MKGMKTPTRHRANDIRASCKMPTFSPTGIRKTPRRPNTNSDRCGHLGDWICNRVGTPPRSFFVVSFSRSKVTAKTTRSARGLCDLFPPCSDRHFLGVKDTLGRAALPRYRLASCSGPLGGLPNFLAPLKTCNMAATPVTTAHLLTLRTHLLWTPVSRPIQSALSAERLSTVPRMRHIERRQRRY